VRTLYATRLHRRDKVRNSIIIFITHDPEIADLADAVLEIDPTG